MTATASTSVSDPSIQPGDCPAPVQIIVTASDRPFDGSAVTSLAAWLLQLAEAEMEPVEMTQ